MRQTGGRINTSNRREIEVLDSGLFRGIDKLFAVRYLAVKAEFPVIRDCENEI